MDSIIKSIQGDILDSNESLCSILLKAKILACQLKNDNLKDWISCELNGYQANGILPDYRILPTLPFGDISSPSKKYERIQIPLDKTSDSFKKIATEIRLIHGIKVIEELSNRNSSITFPMSREEIGIWTCSNFRPIDILFGGCECLQIVRPVSVEIFKQILLTIRSRLLDFILELENLTWKIENENLYINKEIVNRLVNVYIFNQPHNMTTFYQPNQRVQNQNNAGHNILNSNQTSEKNIDNRKTLEKELRKLKREIVDAGNINLIDLSVAEDIEHELSCVIQETKKSKPNRDFMLKRMEKSKDLLNNVAGITALVTAIINLTTVITKWF